MHILIVTMFGFNEALRFSHQDQTASTLAAMGYKVTAYAYRDERHPLHKKRLEQKEGVKIRRIEPPKRIFSLELRKALKEDGPFDIIHLHHLRNRFSYEITQYALDRNIPLVFEPHGMLHDPYLVINRDFPLAGPIMESNLILTRIQLFKKIFTRGPMIRYFKNYSQHFVLKQADILIALSCYERDMLCRITGRHEIEIVPHWVDKEFIDSIEDRYHMMNYRKPVILFVGQLKYRRGFDIAVKTFAFIKREFPSATMVIITNNPERKRELISLAQKTGIIKAMIIKEHVSEEEKFSNYRNADIYLSPTRYEGFGVTFLESMACKCPIVASDIPVVREVIEDGRTGLLARLEDPYDFYKSIRRILRDNALRDRLIRESLKKIEKQYNKKDIFNRLLDVYRKVLK